MGYERKELKNAQKYERILWELEGQDAEWTANTNKNIERLEISYDWPPHVETQEKQRFYKKPTDTRNFCTTLIEYVKEQITKYQNEPEEEPSKNGEEENKAKT